MNRDADGARQEEYTSHVVICQCTDSKRSTPATAKRLYDESDYFQKQRAYAEAVSDRWFIQSALHGLVEPDTMLEPYNCSPSDLDDVEAWAEQIATDLDDNLKGNPTIELLGGKSYTDPLTPELESRGYEVLEPLRGQQIGERKGSLKRMANEKLGTFA